MMNNYTSSNNTSSQIILCDLSNTHPLSSQYFQGIVYFSYSLIFFVSLLGNGIVCYIVVSSEKMKSVTNYYITNLAIGDILITLFCVPFTSTSYIQQYWSFGAIMCPLVNYSQAVSVFVSSYTMVAISIDRYTVIMWPLKPKSSKKLAIFTIFVVWTMAAVTALPIPILSALIQPDVWYELCDRFLCIEDWSQIGMEYEKMYTIILLLFQYVIPLTTLLFTYGSIGLIIWCHKIPGEAENVRDQRIAKSKVKLVKMMVTVVFVFTLCWLPINLIWLTADIINDDMKPYLWFSSHWIAMSHACYNPIIYCYMNSNFRIGFLKVFQSIFCCKNSIQSRALIQSQWSCSIPLNRRKSSLMRKGNCTSTIYIPITRENSLNTPEI